VLCYFYCDRSIAFSIQTRSNEVMMMKKHQGESKKIGFMGSVVFAVDD